MRFKHVESIHDIILTTVKTQERVKLFDLTKRNKTDVRSATMVELFQWVCLHQSHINNGGVYNEHALRLRHLAKKDENKNVTIDIGPSEAAIRHMLGLSGESPGARESLDISEEGFEGEVKELHTSNGIVNIRLGQHGLAFWHEFRKNIQATQAFSALTDEQQTSINNGELGTNKIAQLPTIVRDPLVQWLSPKNIMRAIPRIYCGGLDGFLTINRCDYEFAWKNPCVTQGGRIKYKISRDYFVLCALRLMQDRLFNERKHNDIVQIKEWSLLETIHDQAFMIKPSALCLTDGKLMINLENTINLLTKVLTKHL